MFLFHKQQNANFYAHGFVHRNSVLIKVQSDATVCTYFFLIRFIACSITYITTVILQAQYIYLVLLLSLLLKLASPSV